MVMSISSHRNTTTDFIIAGHKMYLKRIMKELKPFKLQFLVNSHLLKLISRNVWVNKRTNCNYFSHGKEHLSIFSQEK